MSIALSALLFAIVPLLWLSLPALVPHNSPLGVSVPVAHRNDPVIGAGWRRFHITNAVVAVALAAIVIVCGPCSTGAAGCCGVVRVHNATGPVTDAHLVVGWPDHPPEKGRRALV